MLKFNLPLVEVVESLENLNTSYVKVQQKRWYLVSMLLSDLNTSYVKVQRTEKEDH